MIDQPFAKFAEVWPVCGEASQAIYTVTRPFVNPLVNELGLTQPRVMYTLLTARAIEPEAISPERIRQRYPYAAAASWAQPMMLLAERQLFEVQGDGSYRFTPGGLALVTRILTEFYAGLAGIEKTIELEYSAADIARLDYLLGQLVTAALAAPIERFGLTDCHGLVPRSIANGTATTLAQIDQSLDDLNAFRDDAHLAAWKSLSVAGEAWELFTFLWRGDVKNADEMVEKVAYRGHTRAAYQSALGDLIGRGWVREASEGTFEVTASGRQVREEVEVVTDRNFYTPWQVLNDVDVQDLKDLLTRLKTALTHIAETVPA